MKLFVRRKKLLQILSVFILLAFGYHFYRLTEKIDWTDFANALGRPGNWSFLVVAVALMPVNWLLETKKWHLLVNAFIVWPFGKTFRAVLAGVSVSAATPNRIGEIGGRLLVAESTEWPAVLTSSLLGSLCQWTAFLLLAWPALVWVAPFAYGKAWLLTLGPLLLLGGYLGGKPVLIKLLGWLQKRFRWSLEDIIAALESVKFSLMIRAGGYACLRFCVYCTQLYLLLWFFGLELPVLRGIAGIMAIYLIQAGIPLPPGVNLVTRTEIGLLLWKADPSGAVAVLAAFTSLFAINVLLPSLPGYWFIVRKKEMS